MNNFQRLSVEYDGIYGTIDDYTSDANLMNYLFKLKEAISNADYDTIMYTLSGIDNGMMKTSELFHRAYIYVTLHHTRKICG